MNNCKKNYQGKFKHDYMNFGKFAIGGVGFEMAFSMIGTYLMFFCTDIFGISAFTVSGLLLITKLIDAVTDPIMGIIADKTRTKIGRYRPYLLFGAPVFGFMIFLLFSSPDLSAAMKVVFIYTVYIGYSLAFTVVGVPYQALVPVIAKESEERTIVISWKNLAVYVGRVFITTFSIPLVEAFGGGAAGWTRYGALVGFLVALCFWSAALGTKNYDTAEVKMIEKKKTSFKEELQLITKNKPLLMIMIAFGTDMLANAALFAVNMYYFKYVIGRVDLVPITSLALTLTGVAANLVLPALTKKFGKKRLYLCGTALAIVPLAVLLVKPVVPDSALIFLITLFGLISTIPSSLSWAMLPDCMDNAEYLTGIKGNGVVASTFMFFNKFSSALGAFLASFVLGLVGFVANQEQTQVVLTTIVALRFGLPILGYIASLISMSFYDLTESRMLEIHEELERRAQEN